MLGPSQAVLSGECPVWHITTFFSIVNLNVNVPVLLNPIVDITLAFIISTTFHLIMAFPGPVLCRKGTGYLPRPKDPNLDPNIPPPGYRSWELAVWILSSIAFGLGGIIRYVLSSQCSSCGSCVGSLPCLGCVNQVFPRIWKLSFVIDYIRYKQC
jgi:hypothetical protein